MPTPVIAALANMGRALLFALSLVTLAACGSNDDDGGGLVDGSADPPSGDGSGEPADDDPSTDAPLIGRDNHVELIAEAFDLYVGRPYVDEIVEYAYSGTTGRTNTADTACDNGGTATPGDDGRVAFDDCQLGDAVLDGIGETPFNRYGYHLIADNLVVERSPGWRLELDGDMRRLFGVSLTGISVWGTTAASIRLVTPEGTVSVGDATSSFSFGSVFESGDGEFDTLHSGGVSGGFTFRTAVTADRPVRAEIPVDFARPSDSSDDFGADDDFTVGQLRLTAEDGSTLLLDAATADETTVSVEIVVDGESESFVQPWSLWHDRLRFDDEPSTD